MSFLLILFTCGFALGQSFYLSAHDTAGSGEPGISYEMDVYIVNTSGNDMTILISRVTEVLPDEDWNTNMCFGEVCYPPYTDQVGGNILANDSTKFSLTFNTSEQAGYGEALVIFEDYGSSYKDSILFTMKTERQPVFRVTFGDTILVGPTGAELEASGYFYNISSDSIMAYVSRIDNDIPQDWTSVLCFKVCLPPYLDTDSTKLGPGDSLQYKLTFYTSDSTDGSGLATLAFYSDRDNDTVFQSYNVSTWIDAIEENRHFLEGGFRLLGNYPNPFNPGTTIRYYLPLSAQVQITVYDILGKKVAQITNRRQQAGYHGVYFDAKNLPSGAYFYRIQVGKQMQIRKMLLLK